MNERDSESDYSEEYLHEEPTHPKNFYKFSRNKGIIYLKKELEEDDLTNDKTFDELKRAFSYQRFLYQLENQEIFYKNRDYPIDKMGKMFVMKMRSEKVVDLEVKGEKIEKFFVLKQQTFMDELGTLIRQNFFLSFDDIKKFLLEVVTHSRLD